MVKANQDVHLALNQAKAEYKIHYWMAAQKIGCSDYSFSRKLRTELPAEEKERIFKAIEELKKEILQQN